MHFPLRFFLTIFFLFAALALHNPVYSEAGFLNPAEIRANLASWDTRPESAFLPDETFDTGYRSFYRLLLTNCVSYGKGMSGSPGSRLFCQMFFSADSRGTVLLLHGYGSHSGAMAGFTQTLLDGNFSVVLVDLPGHGLSEGERGGIGDFSEYAETISQATSLILKESKGPYYFIGHSTGCAAFLEYLYSGKPNPYRKIIFCAPLIRSSSWDLSRFGYALLSPFLKTVHSLTPDGSHDKDFNRFVREKDPFSLKETPVRWVKALFEWNRKMEARPNLPESILVIQGTDDTVVDFPYNMSFIKTHIPGASIRYIAGAKHQLLNESKEYRLSVENAILDYLNGDSETKGEGHD